MATKMQDALPTMGREFFHELRKKAKANDYNDVTEENKRLMKILLDHEDEFGKIFEDTAFGDDNEFDPDTEPNPYMHISMHNIIETQLEKRSPIEAYQFYLAMLNKKCSRHEAIHLTSVIFMQFFYRVLKNREPFDYEGYKRLLKKYKDRKPHKVWALLGFDGAGEPDDIEE